jgi:3-deoxy-D-manno-octulosonic-acid transferase
MKVHLKVWTSDFKECETFIFPSTAPMEKELISRFIGELDKQFPDNIFKCVPVGAHRYNIVPQPTRVH